MTNDIERTESTGGVALPSPHTSNPLLGGDVAKMPETSNDSRKSVGESTEFSSSVVSTAEDYWESCKKLDQLRCHIGERLSPEAAELYGPTWLCSRRICLLFKWRNKKYGTTLDEPEESSIMLGPRWLILFIDTVGILGCAAIFTAAYKDYGYWEFHLVIWLLGAITVGLMYWCSLTNPGIVRPRRENGLFTKQFVRLRIPVPMYKQLKEKNQQMSEKDDETKVKVESVKQTGTAGMTTVWLYDDKEMTFKECNANLMTPSVLCDTEEGMMEMNLRFCTTCHTYRAPRTHHCSVCDCCVDEMDHHCSWLGCCIGKNNYHLFFAALVSVHIMMICIICFNLINNFSYVLSHQYLTPQEALKLVYYLPIVLYALIFVFGIFFSGLMVVHIYLQMKGMSTTELLKRPFRRRPYYGINPWDLGSKWKNLKYRLFLRTLPSLHSEAYYPVMVSAILEDRKLDMLMQLPKKERERVEKKMQSNSVEGETSEIRE